MSKAVGSQWRWDSRSPRSRAELKAAVPGSPWQAGIDLSNWNWKVVRRFVEERFRLTLSRSSCLNYLHRLGFVLKRPKQRLVKADPVRREAFVLEYAALTAAARRTGALGQFTSPSGRRPASLSGHAGLEPAPGEPAQLQSRFQRRRGYLGLGAPGGDCQPVPGHSCRSAREGGRLFHQLGRPTGGSQTALPDRTANTSGSNDWPRPSRFYRPRKCRFHLGFSLGVQRSPTAAVQRWGVYGVRYGADA